MEVRSCLLVIIISRKYVNFGCLASGGRNFGTLNGRSLSGQLPWARWQALFLVIAAMVCSQDKRCEQEWMDGRAWWWMNDAWYEMDGFLGVMAGLVTRQRNFWHCDHVGYWSEASPRKEQQPNGSQVGKRVPTLVGQGTIVGHLTDLEETAHSKYTLKCRIVVPLPCPQNRRQLQQGRLEAFVYVSHQPPTCFSFASC